jgi:hypothetical protein
MTTATSQAEQARLDLEQFFLDPTHWVYTSKGTSSDITPDSVYHIGQLEVLFENRHFHWHTNRAAIHLRNNRTLSERQATLGDITAQLVWRSNVRYIEREAKKHASLIAEYSSEPINKATGAYAETLVHLGLSKLGLRVVARNANAYAGLTWTATDHDLDFIVESPTTAYGVEVKNTFEYMPTDEFNVKLDMCAHLGLLPVFVVRIRHSAQWKQAKAAGGIIYQFKSKLFPPGQDALVGRIWRQMRLPVAIWHDWSNAFYSTLSDYLAQH